MAQGEGGAIVVSVIDDHPDLCYGVLARLPRTNSSFVAGTMAATVPEFLALDPAERRSDVVLLDLTLKDGSSPKENVARLKSEDYAVVIYTGEERTERLQVTLGIGADALVRKEEAGLLGEALNAIMRGDESWVSPLMAHIVLRDPDVKLSPTQADVLSLYVTGYTAQQVASVQKCAVETVKSHLREVKARFKANGYPADTKIDLLGSALRSGYVRPDWHLGRNPRR
jgi:DNA-binding NarL/FixJ family response regulator